MSRLAAHGIQITFGGLTVLDGVDLTIGPGDRIGILAPNGVGKSTLLKILSGELEPDAGSVTRSPASTTVLRLAQEPDIRPGETLSEHLARRTGVAAAQEALDASTEALTRGDRGADDAYSEALERWLALGSADLPERAGQVTADLGLPPGCSAAARPSCPAVSRPGSRLAAVLLAQPDILLLDEPTNDLDDDGLARLEAHLRGSRAGIALVSHDRALLAGVVTQILELDEFTRYGREFGGGWDAYLAERDRARQRAVDAYAGYEQRARQADRGRPYAAAVGRLRRPPGRRPPAAAGPDKFIKHFRTTGAQNTGAGAARTERAIARLDHDAPDQVREPWHLQLSIAAAGRAGDVVVALRGAVISRGQVTLGPLDLSVGPADRIRIAGPNGVGQDHAGGRAARPPAAGRGRALRRSERGVRGAGSVPPRVLGHRPRGRRGPGRRRADPRGGQDPAGQVPAARRRRPPAGRRPVAGRADQGRAGPAAGARGELPGPGRAHQPPGHRGHRAAGAGPGAPTAAR